MNREPTHRTDIDDCDCPACIASLVDSFRRDWEGERNLRKLLAAECRATRLAETLLMNGEDDPATMRYTEALAAIGVTRKAVDAAGALGTGGGE